MCLVDALHGNCYVCGFDEKQTKIAYPPAYISFEEARRLAKEERYTFRSAESFSDKGEKIMRSDPAEGLLAGGFGPEPRRAQFRAFERAVYPKESSGGKFLRGKGRDAMTYRSWKFEDILKISELEKECFSDLWTYRNVRGGLFLQIVLRRGARWRTEKSSDMPARRYCSRMRKWTISR